ncbi:MAG: DsrE/DsrF/DrsH-like family protein [Acetobacteraceae bacterium]
MASDPVASPAPPVGIILLSGAHDRAHYAFVLAAGAAALGRDVVMFASNRGCIALQSDIAALDDAGREAVIEARGVAGLLTLRSACIEMGVRLIACDAGLRAEALDDAALLPQVEVAGVATFFSAIGHGQIITI